MWIFILWDKYSFFNRGICTQSSKRNDCEQADITIYLWKSLLLFQQLQQNYNFKQTNQAIIMYRDME